MYAISGTARSRTFSRLPAVSGFVLCLASSLMSIGMSQTDSHADKPPQDRQTDAQSVSFRTMEVQVLDESGKPLRDVKVRTNISAVERTQQFPNQTHLTNDEGKVKLRLPNRIAMLRLWTAKAGHVPQFLNFGRGMHEEGQLIPDQYVFRLQRGTRLAGIVVDKQGAPIEGAKIEVRVRDQGDSTGRQPKAVPNPLLTSHDNAVFTDEEGRWSIDRAPPPGDHRDQRFVLRVTHPDYAGDTRWGGLQEEHGVNAEKLRSGTAKIALDKGITLSGMVTGPDGMPITRGIVTWSDRPYWATGINETLLDANGRFESKRLPAGEYPLTVIAPGYGAERKIIMAEHSRADVDFSLKAGQSVQLKILDPSGRPIPTAHVSIIEWRGTQAIYNHQHPNVPASGIPDRTDEKGLYRWDWAPVDAVKYRVNADGYSGTTVSVVAGDQAHEVELESQVTFYGTVTDANSGDPVQRFRAIPVYQDNRNEYSTDFQETSDATLGNYRIDVRGSADSHRRYRVRIEADGYRDALGKQALSVGDPAMEENFQLERAPKLTGLVMNPNGKPTDEFTVAISTPTINPQFVLDRLDNFFGIAFRVTGEYQFQLPATFETRCIRLYNQDGFTEILREPNEDLGIIELESWASISGRMVHEGKPVAGHTVRFNPIVERDRQVAQFRDTTFGIKSDASGRFRLDRIPALPGRVAFNGDPWDKSRLNFGHSIPLQLRPGEHRVVPLLAPGVTVQGRVERVGDHGDSNADVRTGCNLIRRDRMIEFSRNTQGVHLDSSTPLDVEWSELSEFRDWLAKREYFYVRLSKQGEFRIDGVQPGQYDFLIRLFDGPGGERSSVIAEKLVPVTITGKQVDYGKVSLGSIQVRQGDGL